MTLRKIHVIVKGKVQGVFFRASTKQQAIDLGITGWVKNLSDGSVEVVSEGSSVKIEQLLSWLYHGPKLAEVKELVLISDDSVRSQTFTTFRIIYQ